MAKLNDIERSIIQGGYKRWIDYKEWLAFDKRWQEHKRELRELAEYLSKEKTKRLEDGEV